MGNLDRGGLSGELKTRVLELCRFIRTPLSEGYRGAQQYLRESIREFGLEALEHRFDVWGLGTCTNIYCEMGDPAKPRILIGAHYESRKESGVAADDNASACAILLELIPRLQKLSDNSFTVIFFDMEENYGLSSLRGSRAFVHWYRRPLSKVIILDLVGGNLAPGFEKTFLQFGPAFPKLTHENGEFLYLPMKVVEPLGRLGARSDYDEFRKNRIPFLFISTGTPWYYHSANDTPEVLSYEKMATLTETLEGILQRSPHLATGGHGDPQDLQKFIQKFAAVQALRTPRIQKLAERGTDLSRFEIVMLYKDVLGQIRKLGPGLWA